MNKPHFAYSRLYVHTQDTLGEINNYVIKSIDGKMDFSTILAGNVNIHVMTNDDYDEAKVHDLKDGFLNYRFTFEVWQSVSEPTRANFSAVLSKLLTNFWANNIPAVACYEFEEDLPENGGYLSHNVPRPVKE